MFRRLWLRMTLPASLIAVLSILSPPSAWAGAEFIVESQLIDGPNGNERVGVYVTPAADMWGCSQTNWLCTDFEAVIRITPCPFGYTCPDDTFEVTVDSYNSGNIAEFTTFLELGTTYEFSGTWRRSVGYDSPCEHTCFYEEDIEPLSHQATPAEDVGRWDVLTLSADADTVWVLATPNVVHLDPYGCSAYTCFSQIARLAVDPCPLAIRGIPGGVCPSGGIPPGNTLEVALEPGVLYSFGGSFRAEGDEEWCFVDEPLCSYYERFIPMAYSYDTTPAAETTWGVLKSHYVDE